MADVRFEEPRFDTQKSRTKSTGGIEQWLVNTGLAKSKSQAKVILIIVFILIVAITFYIIRSIGNEVPIPPTAET